MDPLAHRALRLAAVLAGLLIPAASLPAVAAPPRLADLPAFSLEPSELLAAAEAARPEGETDVVALLYETRFTFDEAGRMHYVRRYVYQVLSERAVRGWSDVAMNWSPWHQERPEIRARVISSDGNLHWLDPATLTDVTLESSEPNIFQDRRQLGGPLPAMGVGAVVEEQIEVEDREPLFSAGVVRRQFLALAGPLAHGRVVLDAPESLPLHWSTGLLPEVEPAVERTDGRIRLTFDVHDVPERDEDPPGLPAEVPRFPYVGFATGASWEDVARGYAELVDRQVGEFRNPEGVPGETDGGREARIAATVRWLHERVRYTGLELGEAAIVPRAPGEVLTRHYGDCKDKATLLVALLRNQGIPAHVALLNVGSGQDVDPRLPGLTGLGGFDHAIVYVPGEPVLWIDATDPFSPVGELPPDDQGRLALIAAPETTALVTTPVSDARTNQQVSEREIVLAELGKGREIETTLYRGAPAREVRSVWSLVQAQIDENAGAQDVEIEAEAVEDLGQPLRVRIETPEVDHAATDLTEAVVAIRPAGLLERLPAELTDAEADPREHDYLVSEPHTVEWRYRIVPPPGFVLRDLPPNQERPLGPARYTSEIRRVGEEVEGTLRFTLDQRRLSPEELDALRTGTVKLSGEPPLLIWFDQLGASHLQAGRVAEALEEYRRLVSLHPDEALHHVQLANALLVGGLGAEAREAARRATEVEPESGLAFHSLGLILSSDLVGRRLRAGFDRDGARTAFESALEIDPDDLDSQVQLALVLEHGPEAERYGEGADLDGAIEVYRSVQDRLAETVFRDNLHFAMLHAGRFEELAEALQGSAETAARKALLTAAEAMVRGADEAIHRAERRPASDSDERRQVLLQAGQHLLIQRHYAEAAALTTAAARSAANAAELLKLADQLRRARRHEDVRPTADTPEGAVRALILTMAGPEPDPDAFVRLLAPSVRGPLEELLADEEDRASLVDVLVGGLEAASGEVSRQVVIDLFLGTPFDVSGNDRQGYRIRLFPPMPQLPEGLHAYVAASEGVYRVGGLSTAPSMLGLEALARLELGDAATASLWLDWAADLQAGGGGPDDPLARGPLPLLWTRGAGPGDAEVRIAAAGLAAGMGLPDDALDLLSGALEQAEGRRRQGIALALALHHVSREEWEDALAAARLLEAELPRSLTAFMLAQASLRELGREEELVEGAKQRAERLPEDLMARRITAEGLMHLGALEEAREIYRRIEGDGRAESSDYNQLAWLGLFGETLDERALDWAQRAAELDGYAESASLHTLATVYAEAGRPADAYRVILQAIEAKPRAAPEPHDWYVFGRLAELYGLPGAAASYYRQVEEEDAHEASTWRLAERRLSLLAAKAPAAPSDP